MDKDNDGEFDYEIMSEDYPTYDLPFKVIILGDSGVGKSELYIKKQFSNAYLPRIRFEFHSFVMRYGNKIIKLQIWDTCGQEIYKSLVLGLGFYRNASLAIFVYAIDK